MYAGFCIARGDYVAVMDADLQDPPSLLPEMLEKLESGEYDSVATRRVSRDGEQPIRSFFARKFYQLINKISDADIVDGARDFRLMKRSMVDAIVSMSEYNRFSKGIFGWIGETLPASMAFLCPNVNSYRRFGAQFYVPNAPSWGLDNRTVAVRVPTGSSEAMAA